MIYESNGTIISTQTMMTRYVQIIIYFQPQNKTKNPGRILFSTSECFLLFISMETVEYHKSHPPLFVMSIRLLSASSCRWCVAARAPPIMRPCIARFPARTRPSPPTATRPRTIRPNARGSRMLVRACVRQWWPFVFLSSIRDRAKGLVFSSWIRFILTQELLLLSGLTHTAKVVGWQSSLRESV